MTTLSTQTPEDGTRHTEAAFAMGSRRPAGVYIPRWRSGPPAAWDFAVKSGLRVDLQSDAISSPDAVTRRYEDLKSSHRDTRADCEAQGFSFVPMVVEAVGGCCGEAARKIWSELAKKSVLATGELETKRSCTAMLRQRLSLTLHRENARACLRRFGH